MEDRIASLEENVCNIIKENYDLRIRVQNLEETVRKKIESKIDEEDLENKIENIAYGMSTGLRLTGDHFKFLNEKNSLIKKRIKDIENKIAKMRTMENWIINEVEKTAKLVDDIYEKLEEDSR
jgi:hypothetical protein